MIAVFFMKVLNLFVSSSSLKVFGAFATTPVGKATVAAGVGGSGLFTIVFALHTTAMSEIKNQKVEIKEYVVEKLKDRDDVFKTHVINFDKNQIETNKRLNIVIEHLITNK